MSTEPTPPTTGDTESKSTADAIPAPDGHVIPATAAPEPPAAQEPAATAATAPAAETTAAAPAAAAEAAQAKSDRLSALVVGRRLLRLALTAVILAAGVYAGWQVYTTSRPAAPVVGDPMVGGAPTPAIVSELANAVAADDSDSIRAALSPEIFASYTAELQTYGISGVNGVEILGTYADGPRSASMIIINARNPATDSFTLFFVIVTENGRIVKLR